TVRANADEWHVDPKRVCVVGFSAGGMICASLATQWKTGPFAALAGARPDDIRPDAVVLGYPLLDFAYVRDMQTRDPRIDLRVPKTGGKTGRDLLNDYLSMVTGGEATDEHLADICPTTHVSRQMPPTFVWGVSDDKTAPIAQVYPFAQRMAEEGVACEMHVFDQGGHGLSLGNANTAVDNEDKQVAVRPWIRLAFRFLERHL
ncbi:MAG: alpha/beta hydrolase, partial [Collinsella sp.]